MARTLSDWLNAHKSIDGCSRSLYILLYRVCYMMLCPKNISMPFDAIIKYEGGAHSGRMENFDREDFEMLEKIFYIVEDKRVRARVADMLWSADLEQFPLPLKQRFKFLLDAIDSYMALPLEPSAWVQDGEVCWQRCAVLVKQIKSSHRSLYKEFRNRLVNVGMEKGYSNPFFQLRILTLLQEFDIEVETPSSIAECLQRIAPQFEQIKRYDGLFECYEAAEWWYRKAKNVAKSVDLIVKCAEVMELEADSLPALWVDRNMAKAKELLQRIPHKYREECEYEARIARVEHRQGIARKQTLEQLVKCTYKINPTPYILEVESLMESKTQEEAWFILLKIAHLYGEDSVNKSVQENRNSAPLLHRIPHVVFGKNELIRGLTSSNPEDSNEETERCFFQAMAYKMLIEYSATWRILPILNILHREYRITEKFFAEVVASSGLVPIGREEVFIKGLYYGYNFDFETAMHILSPQLENLVRVFLKAHGVNTLIVKDGIEDEKSLNALIEMEQAKEWLGEDIVFNINMLFCHPLGGNIRNDIAHGIADSEECNSPVYVYAWWFILHLLYKSSRFVYPVSFRESCSECMS